MMNAHHYFFFTTGFLVGPGVPSPAAAPSFSTLRPDPKA
jgi:hypothetical protein